MDEIILLNRIRVDIGNVSGSLSELMQYAGMTGFNDNYEPQAKPRLVGTWTINDWYTSAQLAQAQVAFDGLTIVGDPNYVIDFSKMAVQVLDNTQPNYNPAAAIILQAANKGHLLPTPVIEGQTGRWFINKSEAANVANYSLFNGKTTLVDSNGIVTADTSLGYSFTTFHEFRFFSGYTKVGEYGNVGGNFWGSNNITHLSLPESIVSVRSFAITQNAYKKELFIYNDFLPSLSRSNAGYGSDIGGAMLADNFPQDWRHVIVGIDKNKYEGSVALEYFKQLCPGYPRFIYHYDYVYPKFSYTNGVVTVTVERTEFLDKILYKKSSDNEWTEIASGSTFSWDGVGYIEAKSIYTDFQEYTTEPFYSQTCANPTITISNNQVILSCATSGATIHYTTDGSYPTLDSPIYSTPITSQEDILKVRCFAIKEGMNDSEVVGKMFIFNDALWGTDGDTSSFAVQCIDSSKPNYNPAVCIILYNNGKLTDECYGGGGYLTKTDAAAITSVGSMFAVKTVTDTQNICGHGNYQTYDFTSFNEFIFFTNVSDTGFMFDGTIKLVSVKLPNLTYIESYSFRSSGVKNIEIPATVLRFGNLCFQFTNVGWIHFLSETPIYINFSNAFYSSSFPSKLYVGDGSSSSHDNAILASYQAASGWSSYSSYLDTWYNYLHPQS